MAEQTTLQHQGTGRRTGGCIPLIKRTIDKVLFCASTDNARQHVPSGILARLVEEANAGSVYPATLTSVLGCLFGKTGGNHIAAILENTCIGLRTEGNIQLDSEDANVLLTYAYSKKIRALAPEATPALDRLQASAEKGFANRRTLAEINDLLDAKTGLNLEIERLVRACRLHLEHPGTQTDNVETETTERVQ